MEPIKVTQRDIDDVVWVREQIAAMHHQWQQQGLADHRELQGAACAALDVALALMRERLYAQNQRPVRFTVEPSPWVSPRS